jgi:type IV secretion system protein VirB5
MGLFSRGNKSNANGGVIVIDNNTVGNYKKKDEPDATNVKLSERLETGVIDESPWLRGKNRHMDVYLSLANSIATWRNAALLFLLTTILSVIGNIYLSTSVKVQPYVVQVDQHGYAIPIQMAEVAGVDQRVISSQIGQFIMNSRIRVSDKTAQLLFSKNSYRSIAANSIASRYLTEYYQKNPPTSAKYPIDIEIKSILPLTEETYQAEWVERSTNENKAKLEAYFQGVYQIAIAPPNDMNNLVNNPLGVYITEYRVQQKIN